MMRAGVPLVQSFEIVADGVDKPKLRDLVLAIRSDVSSGNTFASALRKHPVYFDDLFCNSSMLASSQDRSRRCSTESRRTKKRPRA